MRAVVIGTVVLLGILSCQQGEPGHGNNQTQRHRDSVLGASRLPGVRGVRGALDVGDAAAARRAREDTVSREP